MLPLCVSLLGCQAQKPRPIGPEIAEAAISAADARQRAEAVVVVVIDGARWQEVFQGVDPKLAARCDRPQPLASAEALMPNLHASVRTAGALAGNPLRGEDFVASGPNFVSMPGYTEILTGRPAFGCTDNNCGPALEPTVADEIRATVADRDEDVAVFSSWEPIRWLATAHPGTIVTSSGRSEPDARLLQDEELADLVDRGARAAPWPGMGGYRPDEHTAAIALRYLETHQPRFMFVALGDTDEYAHRGDYSGYLTALRRADAFIGDLGDTLGRMGTRGEHTTIFVTTDHGRADGFRDHGGFAPESAHVWMAELGASGAGRKLPRAAHLADIAPRVRQLLGVRAGAANRRAKL